MTIGGSIALFAIGAILRYAISWSPSHVNVPLIGAILMIAGAIGFIISVAFLFARRRRAAVPPGEVYEERRLRDGPGAYPGSYTEERRYSETPRRYDDPPL